MFNPGCHHHCLHIFYPKVVRAYKVPESSIELRGGQSLVRHFTLSFLCEPSNLSVARLLNLPGEGFVCPSDYSICVLAPLSSSSPTTILPSLRI
ncbi:hypothetical protein GYMLUDRAFT_880368 [Collybiopsis luxurians FD-317 M1]|uniref:Uncharacterized protein n=1 Tax=Collybiopsis luxurians FD-317 M1 TaxID=944289 RepID=A0A0D0CJS2_9AGAR|nr:hypothetical protein GYMLUDRAFT_880368 [Collybiopsis luxurians FD-317 M1]